MLNILLIGNNVSENDETYLYLKEQFGSLNIEFCNHYEKVFKKAVKLYPDIILLEYSFNNNRGSDLCSELKDRFASLHSPVILISEADTISDERVRALVAGADSVITKPFDKAELIANINVMLRIKRAEDKLRKQNEDLQRQVKIAIHELSNKEKRYSDMFNSAANIIVLISKDGVVEEWNTAAENLFEVNKASAVGCNFEEIILNKIMRADINDKLTNREEGRGRNEYQINIKTKSGKKYQVLWTISQLYDSRNNLTSILVIGQDISTRVKEEQERKISQIRLRNNLNLLTTLMNTMPSPIYYKNTKDKYLGCNSDFADFYNTSVDNIVGKTTSDLNTPEIAQEIIDEDKQVFSTGKKQVKEISSKLKDGKIHHYILNKIAFYNPDGTIGGLVGVMVEVTKLKQMEEELRESEMFFKGITDSANDAIILIDKSYKIHFWNKAAELLFGFKKKEFINQVFFQVFNETKDKELFVGLVEEILQNKIMANQANIIELYAHKKSGEEFPVEFSVSSIRIRRKDFAIIIAKDISLRKQTEETLLKAKDKAEEADRLKSAFLANMSHEIRTPMNAIVGFSELLGNPAIDDDKKKVFIEQININSESLLQLIEDIIYVSKIESGKIDIKKSLCLLNNLLDEIQVSFIEHKRRMEKEHLNLIVEKGFDDEHFALFTDEQRFKQILSNLLSNAIKFTEEGSITYGYKKTNDDKLLFYVKDTGLGISSEKLKYIFDRFTKVSATKTKLYGGTGLGLSITHHLVECLGGKIWVESEESKGSIFYFTHPLQYGRGEIIDKKTKQYIRENMSLENKNILIAEDEQMNYFFLQEALSLTGANIEWAKNGLEAVNFVENSNEVDVILMDMKMPIMDGYEATAKIKQIKPNLPVIAQTAYAMPEEKEKGMNAGCDSYLSKPVDPELLIDTIQQHLSEVDG